LDANGIAISQCSTELAPIRASMVPEDTDRVDRLAGLPSHLRSQLLVNSERVVISDRYGYEGAWPSEILVTKNPTPLAVSEARLALAAYRELCRPLDDEDLAVALTKLREVLPSQRKTDHEFAVGLDAMMDDLAKEPADLLLWAIGFWRRCERWYPVPADLLNLIERRKTGRQAIMSALERLIAFGEAAAEEDRIP
jgi:hypothetical protein